MASSGGHTNRRTSPDLHPMDTTYSAAVESFLGGPNSAQRRMRLDAIRERLRAEGSPVVIKEPGEPPFIAYLTDNASTGREEFHIVDLSELPAPTFDVLNTTFGLSNAEVRLAQMLARGESVESAARLLEIKTTTARSQLAAIFEKTGTRRQAKLVALLSRLAHTSR
jgi:DNA-binding CsgD family transcriptional regulator